MKFNVTKEKLLEGLQQVQNVVSTRTTLPILSNVLLQAKGNEVHLTTTDLDVGVRGSFEANVEKEGATTLPARRLFTIIRELPSSEVSVEVDGKNAASIRKCPSGAPSGRTSAPLVTRSASNPIQEACRDVNQEEEPPIEPEGPPAAR